MTISPTTPSLADLAVFLDEAARYFERRDTGGEDRAFWSNISNAENCRHAAQVLRASPQAGPTAWLYELFEQRELSLVRYPDRISWKETPLYARPPVEDVARLRAADDGWAPISIRPTSEDVHAWIARAYREPDDPAQLDDARFTRWNMEVAFQAGFGAAYAALSPAPSQDAPRETDGA